MTHNHPGRWLGQMNISPIHRWETEALKDQVVCSGSQLDRGRAGQPLSSMLFVYIQAGSGFKVFMFQQERMFKGQISVTSVEQHFCDEPF